MQSFIENLIKTLVAKNLPNGRLNFGSIDILSATKGSFKVSDIIYQSDNSPNPEIELIIKNFTAEIDVKSFFIKKVMLKSILIDEPNLKIRFAQQSEGLLIKKDPKKLKFNIGQIKIRSGRLSYEDSDLSNINADIGAFGALDGQTVSTRIDFLNTQGQPQVAQFDFILDLSGENQDLIQGPLLKIERKADESIIKFVLRALF